MNMTQTRWYVARIKRGQFKIERCTDRAHATAHANHLYRACGVVAPVVVAAANIEAATSKARRALAREITLRAARDPRVA
jgi:hypothetical protein